MSHNYQLTLKYMIDLGKLVAQGRAHSATRAWEPEELEALLHLERERGIARPIAADYIRNGILTLESYDAAVKAKFEPLTIEDAVAKAEALLKQNKFATKEAEPVAEAPVEAGLEVAVEASVETPVEPVAEAPVGKVTKSGKKK